MDAILYTSNTGNTAEYAKLLGAKLGLPAYPLKDAPVKAGAEIIYLGWLMGGNVKGSKKAAKKYSIKALCGVGMAATGSQLDDIRKMNPVGDDVPVFSMQGGFDLKKLHGIYHFMMNAMSKTQVKALGEKKDRTQEEDEMYNMFVNGACCVSEENLKELLDWYGGLK